MAPTPISAAPTRAAAYLRMSTESQNYSLEHQEAAIAAYAVARGFQVVATYTDGGISGLTLRKREGLKRLLGDVLSGDAGFSAILTYDVSRWGRFQDVDESAHYEFLCRQAGVHVEYCAEVFENDGSMVATLLKTLKRTMAAEKSRDLSDTITLSKRRLGLKGLWQGGNPGYGLRRATVPDASGPSMILNPGERNGLKGRRITVAAGPMEEVEIVREAFRLFTTHRTTPNAVARLLNAGHPNSYRGKPWSQACVRRLLQNELYIGTRILGRARVHLGEWEARPPSEWVAVPNAFPHIVKPAAFREAQRRLQRHQVLTDEVMLDRLRALWAKHGRLSHNLITRELGMPSSSAYRQRFGSLAAAYERLGYQPTPEQVRITEQLAPYRSGGLRPRPSALTDAEVIERLRTLWGEHGMLTLELIEITPGLPRVRSLLRRFGSIAHLYGLLGYEPTPRQRQRLGKPSPAPRHRACCAQPPLA